jgi:hypothetical protein
MSDKPSSSQVKCDAKISLGFAPKAALCLTRSAAFLLLDAAQDKPGSAQLKSRKRRGNRVGMTEETSRESNALSETIP